MKIGLQIPYFTYPGGHAAIRETFGRIVREAEAAGFHSLWVMDHYFQLDGWGPPDFEMLECYTALSYAAALTERIKLGPLVAGVTYRRPGILVKTATTLDVLSGGRSYFGIGAAWYEEEHKGLGVPFPPRKERFEMLEETLRIAQQMWSGEAKPFQGKHYELAETLNSPNSLQRPHPPIMIGGVGEEKTFRLIARYADACNIFTWRGVDYVKGKYDVLRRRCEEANRPYADIEKTTLSEMIVTPDGTTPEGVHPAPDMPSNFTTAQAIEHFHQLAEIGTDHAIFNSPITHIPGALDVWGSEIIPAVEKFVPAGR
ncbi:MAG TPA: LLM class F420-dependent oxidoreductase [Chloroflexia bacterium]|nr:LLM class F420-dependent oxidoreductase [Chloroflexia bacterium]